MKFRPASPFGTGMALGRKCTASAYALLIITMVSSCECVPRVKPLESAGSYLGSPGAMTEWLNGRIVDVRIIDVQLYMTSIKSVLL